MGSFRRRSKTGQRGGCGDGRRCKGGSSLQPCPGGHALRVGAPGPSPVMPVPGAHTPSVQLRYRVPQAQLSLAHAGEARGEDMTLAREDRPHGPHSLVGRKPLLGGGGDRERRHPAACPGESGGPSNQLADLGVGGGDRGWRRKGQFPGGLWLVSGLESAGRARLSADPEPLSALRAGSPGTQRGSSQMGAPRSASALLGAGRGLRGCSRLTQRRSERARPARPGLPGPRARVVAHSSC